MRLPFLFMALLLMGCQNQALTWIPSTDTSISGQLLIDSATKQRSCSDPTASLYKLSAIGDRIYPALSSSPIDNKGKYSFNLNDIEIKRDGKKLKEPLIISVEGCDIKYLRPVTGTHNQDTTLGSTVLSFAFNSGQKEKLTKSLSLTPSKVEQLLNAVITTMNPDEVIDIFQSSLVFNNFFEEDTSFLMKAAPEIKSMSIPTKFFETSPALLSVIAQHWHPSYEIIYIWKVDGKIVSRNSSFTWTPSANLQGQHTISVILGKNNGSGNLDTSSPFQTLSQAIKVENNLLPEPPSFELSSPNPERPISNRGLMLRLATGNSLEFCESFSRLAFTETPIPPNAEAFNIICTDSGIQNVSYTLFSAEDGPKTLYLWAIDESKVISATPKTISLILDTTAPSAMIASISTRSGLTSQTMIFTGSDATASIESFLCQIDANIYASCSSPKTFTDLSEGPHTFSVKAIDFAGNVSAPNSLSWSVDLTPPILLISGKPNPVTNQITSIFNFSALDTAGESIAEYRCGMNSNQLSTCFSPFLSVLSAGIHTFKVQAIDFVGNASELQTYSWMIDLSPPVTTLTSSTATFTNMTAATFFFSSIDSGGGSVSGHECSLDASNFSSCLSGISYSSLAQGVHNFRVRSLDNSANTSPIVSYNWTIDLNPPSLSLISTPMLITNLSSATFGFSGTDTGGGSVVSYSCKLDGDVYSSCSSLKIYSGLTQGSHNFSVTAQDSAGNISSPVSYNWIIDTTPPTTTITSYPVSLVESPNASFTFLGTDSGGSSVQGFECKLDAGSFSSCSSSQVYSALSDGSHTLSVRAFDRAL